MDGKTEKGDREDYYIQGRWYDLAYRYRLLYFGRRKVALGLFALQRGLQGDGY